MNQFNKGILALFLGAYVTLGAARAEPTPDMSTLTCQDWIDASDDEQELMIAWLRGYAAARSTSTLFNPLAMRVDRGAMAIYCHANPAVGVISAGGHLPSR